MNFEGKNMKLTNKNWSWNSTTYNYNSCKFEARQFSRFPKRTYIWLDYLLIFSYFHSFNLFTMQCIMSSIVVSSQRHEECEKELWNKPKKTWDMHLIGFHSLNLLEYEYFQYNIIILRVHFFLSLKNRNNRFKHIIIINVITKCCKHPFARSKKNPWQIQLTLHLVLTPTFLTGSKINFTGIPKPST